MRCSRAFVLVHALAMLAIVHCEVDDDGYNENYFEDTLRPEDILDPHSFYYKEQNEQVLKDVPMNGEENTEISTAVKSRKADNNYSMHEAVFYKRLVNLLLANIHIQDKDEISISGILEIEMTHAEMKTLENFPVNKTSLRDIDEILSNIIKKPRFDYINSHGGRYILDLFQQGIGMLFETVQNNPDGALILFAMLMVFCSFKMFKWGQRLPIVALIQIMFILSFFMTWWHLIQEAEAKFRAEQKKYTEMPISCHPEKMSYWDKFVSLFYHDDCEQYYKTMMLNPKLKVTPAFAMSHFITTVILYPITHVGTIISVFIRNATDDLPFTYGWIVKCMFYLVVCIVIITIPFWLSSAAIYLPFGFGIRYFRNKNQGNSLPSIEKREPVQIYLQVSQGTGVAQIKDTSEAERSKPLKAALPEIEDVTDKSDDLSKGDVVDKIETNDNKKSQECEEERVKKHDGSGDN